MTDYRKQSLIEVYNKMRAAERGIEGMTNDQFTAIHDAIKAIDEAMDYALECHDLRLSDIDRLQRAQFALQRSINTEPNEYQMEGFREYGIGEFADDDDTADE